MTNTLIALFTIRFHFELLYKQRIFMPGLFVIIYFKDPSLSFEFNSLRPQFFEAISDSNLFQLMFHAADVS